MSAPVTASRKVPKSSIISNPRSKNQLSLSAASGAISHSPTTPKASRHHYLHRSKEHFKDTQGQTSSQNLKIIPANVTEKISKDGIDSVYASSGNIPSTSLAYHNNAVYGLKKEDVRSKEYHAEREWASHYVSELHNAITDLQKVSSKINRRLDDTYYSILEKLSSLQSTIMGLKELAAMTRQLNVRLVSECHKVAHDSNKQLDCLDDFQDQAKRIKQLKNRVDIGRQNFLCLVERVRHVQKRVEGWETDEREWRKTTRKRLRIFWSFVIGILAIALLLYLLSWWLAEHEDGKLIEYTAVKQINGSQVNKTKIEDLPNSVLRAKVDVPDELNNQYCNAAMNSSESSRELDEL